MAAHLNFRRIFNWLQFDKSLSFALLGRIWQAVSGPITIALQIYALSLAELGVFYGVLSIIAVQPLFELGMASVLISQAGNLFAKVSDSQAESIEVEARLQLAWLARAALRWFASIAVLYAVGGILLGWKVLGAWGLDILDWRLPLILSVVLSAISFGVSPRVYVLEGAGEREFIYRMRLLQALAGSLTIWLALYFGLKLWAIVAIFFVSAAFNLGVAFGPRARRLLSAPRGATPSQQISWLSRIGPLQWRMAIFSAAHYLASQLFYIYVLNYHGLVSAAPLGMTLQVAVAIQALAMTWAQTKFPLISLKQAAGEREVAGTLWRRSTLVSSGLLIMAMVFFSILVSLLPLFERGWERRFVRPELILVLGIGYVSNHWIALQSYYVLSRGAKPLTAALLTGLLTTSAAVWIGAWAFSVTGVIWAYCLAMTCAALPLHTLAYFHFRTKKN